MVDEHVPVLADRVSALLRPALTQNQRLEDGSVDRSVLVDCTLGLGGHTTALLAEHPSLQVIGIDRDPTALQMATERVASAGFADRFSPAHAVYDEIEDVLADRGISAVQAILFDLGVSSMQLDRTDRGFAYSVDAPLDMRMDPTVGITAADVLNTYAPGEIVRVLREYGEEKFATRIVSEVVKRRKNEPWTTSGPLVELIRQAIPAAARRTGGHPAKRTFQALRIEVNDELGVLRRAIPAAVRCLALGGRIAVISFQSLEDRIVKKALAPLTVSAGPLDLPVDLPEFAPELRWITRGSEAPTEAEIIVNSRAASAKVRAAERIREAK